MNNKGTVIIGSQFGDEGKGLMTDYFSHQSRDAIVVRFNGGAQAGHTVVTPQGLTHAHGHFGSGSLNGTPTYLGKYFIVSPRVFISEQNELSAIGINPKVYVNPECIVTTPIDVHINRAAELFRNNKKHGSCGEGINETVERNLIQKYKITVKNLLVSKTKLEKKLNSIRNDYLPKRLAKLGIPEDFFDYESLDKALTAFPYFVSLFLSNIEVKDTTFISTFYDIVFEGAQGLMLDENHRYFPYVTRSSTGLKNAHQIATEIGLTELDVVYVTRSYTTRHGAGPLKFEHEKLVYDIVDPTNTPNPYQDTIRYAYLDIDNLKEAIDTDFNSIAEASTLTLNKQLAITCLDQIKHKAFYYVSNHLYHENVNLFIKRIKSILNMNEVVYESYGNTRETIMRTNAAFRWTNSVVGDKIKSLTRAIRAS